MWISIELFGIWNAFSQRNIINYDQVLRLAPKAIMCMRYLKSSAGFLVWEILETVYVAVGKRSEFQVGIQGRVLSPLLVHGENKISFSPFPSLLSIVKTSTVGALEEEGLASGKTCAYMAVNCWRRLSVLFEVLAVYYAIESLQHTHEMLPLLFL